MYFMLVGSSETFALIGAYPPRLALRQSAFNAATSFTAQGPDGLHIDNREVQEIRDQATNDGTDKEAKKRVLNDTLCNRVLDGHLKAVTTLYYEDCLATGSSDKVIPHWVVNAGQCISTMDILRAISNPPAATVDTINHPLSPRRPGLLGRSSMHYRSSSYDDHDVLASPGGSFLSPPSAGLLSAAERGVFRCFYTSVCRRELGNVPELRWCSSLWGYALACGSGDGGARMWDSK
ncbi:hypothetical protein QFC22_006296 [Naganishia vaughanmartiniae]|uniref:Uncharacterized protein n=1 Tax=Naganishia vaughanmartiniae TaxID=1424756 RepID=A0ACC2WMC8_9TREE|nr:hypothetical protein QFC22_006296 [Naganishia vaughanmartiniae]